MSRTILIHLNVTTDDGDSATAEDIAEVLNDVLGSHEATHDLDLAFVLVEEVS